MASLLKQLPSVTTLLSAYASLSALTMLIRTIINEMIPTRFQEFLSTKLAATFSHWFSSDFTFVVEERWEAVHNETFRAVELYLPTIIGPSTTSLLVGSNNSHDPTVPPKPSIPVDSEIRDEFQGIRLEWSLHSVETKKYYLKDRKYYNLTCKKQHRERILKNYFPHIARTAQSILNKRESLSIYTYDQDCSTWESTVFRHPSTFDTLAMDPEAKQSIVDDLDAFVQRKEFFETVGRAWKRGYLLYGPPGTGKSSLVAAIANYMRYNVYDLQFQTVKSDADLRKILTATTNRSILLIEDIDCSAKVSHDRGGGGGRDGGESDSDSDGEDKQPTKNQSLDPGVTLSGLLNFIDGLWSSCGDERIIIFTTNHKDKLDPALLRPGRMDVHIYMGYCTPFGFKKLATTYLGIKDHTLFSSIEDLVKNIEITPAEVAQQLMKNEKPDVALEGLIAYLNDKRDGVEEGVDGDGDGYDKKGEEKIIKEVVVKKVKKGKGGGKKNGGSEGESEIRSIYMT